MLAKNGLEISYLYKKLCVMESNAIVLSPEHMGGLAFQLTKYPELVENGPI